MYYPRIIIHRKINKKSGNIMYQSNNINNVIIAFNYSPQMAVAGHRLYFWDNSSRIGTR